VWFAGLCILVLIFGLGTWGLNTLRSTQLDDLLLSRTQRVVEVVRPDPTPAGIVPVEGPAFVPVTVTFSFNGGTYSIAPEVANGIYYGAVNVRRTISMRDALTKQEQYQEYYRRLTFDPEMDAALTSVLIPLRAIRDAQGYDDSAYAELIVKYVQSIPYDTTRLATATSEETIDGDPRMPVQVLVEGTADCDEKVMLAAALLGKEGFSTAALLYVDEQHMSLGLMSDRVGYRNTGYEFVETTSPAYISEIPDEFVGGVQLVSEPMVLVLSEGPTRFSGVALDQIAHIIGARDSALAAAAQKRAYVESTPMSPADFEWHVVQYDACFIAYNRLRKTVDPETGLPRDEYAFMDRIEAINWLAQNNWWY